LGPAKQISKSEQVRVFLKNHAQLQGFARMGDLFFQKNMLKKLQTKIKRNVVLQQKLKKLLKIKSRRASELHKSRSKRSN